jgi:hypothetical protein
MRFPKRLKPNRNRGTRDPRSLRRVFLCSVEDLLPVLLQRPGENTAFAEGTVADRANSPSPRRSVQDLHGGVRIRVGNEDIPPRVQPRGSDPRLVPTNANGPANLLFSSPIPVPRPDMILR